MREQFIQTAAIHNHAFFFKYNNGGERNLWSTAKIQETLTTHFQTNPNMKYPFKDTIARSK